MKKLWFVMILGMGVLFLNSCQKDISLEEADEVLIEIIATADYKVAVTPEEMPEGVDTYLKENHFETFIEGVSLVEDKGYEVEMGTGDLVYFNMQGRCLRARILRGICRRVAHATPVDVNNIPQAIVTYVNNNFPGTQIVRAKRMGNGNLILGLSDHTILRFDINDQFVTDVSWLSHCSDLAHPMPVANLPAGIVTAINTNFPNATIVRAARKNGRFLVGVVIPNGDRKIFVFDSNGNLLFIRG